MASDFVFVDETGDAGAGGSAHFGMALLHVRAADYESVRKLLATVRWSFSLFSEIKLRQSMRPAQRILEGLAELSDAGVISASGLLLTKARYPGRYLKWSDTDLSPREYPCTSGTTC